jgi:primary-amine oxidase
MLIFEKQHSMGGLISSVVLAATFTCLGLFPCPPAFAQTTPPKQSLNELEIRHRERIRLIEELNRKRPIEKANPLPAGLEVISIEKMQELIGKDAKTTISQTQKKAAQSTTISKNACMLQSYSQVSWLFCVTDMGKKSLWVGPVFIKRSPTDAWHKVAALAGMADIFVPYQNNNFRPYDLMWVSRLNQVGAAESGPNGSVITLTNETAPTVVVENRERGIGLLCHQNPNVVKHSQELAVWGIADGDNYDNIIQYSFRDDGVMTFRMGNTGYADPSNQRGIHTHNGLWRVDLDVNNSANDSASLNKHFESQGVSSDQFAAVSYESSHPIVGTEFSTLLVSDANYNAQGNSMGYEIVPSYSGISRHFEPNEMWTQNDIYVSRYHFGELGWVADVGTSVQTIPELITGTGWADPDHYLLAQISQPEYVTNSDLVAWVKTSFHHVPTDEENPVVATPNAEGVTSTHWSGFDIMPHNFFDANPLSPHVTCNH